MNWRRTVSFLGTLGLLLSLLPFSALARPVEQDFLDKVEPLVLQELDAQGRTDFFLWLAEQADVSGASRIPDRLARRTYVYETLRATAANSPSPSALPRANGSSPTCRPPPNAPRHRCGASWMPGGLLTDPTTS